MAENNNNFQSIRDLISSGSTPKDVGISLISGLGQSLMPQGRYYVQTNWKGNGLADSRLGYMGNPYYRDYFSGGSAMHSLLNRNLSGANQDNKQSAYGNILSKLAGLKGNLGEWASNRLYKLNQPSFQKQNPFSEALGNFTYPSNSFGDDKFITPSNKYIV